MCMMLVNKHQVPNFKFVFITAIQIMLFLKNYIFNGMVPLFFGLEGSFYCLELLCGQFQVKQGQIRHFKRAFFGHILRVLLY